MKRIPTLRRRRAAPAAPRHSCELLEPRCLLAAAATTFAVIGDYGYPVGRDEQVAAMVKGWDPDVILTVGDNNYPTGSAATIDYNIGRLYHDYIYNYRGAFGAGSPTRRFMPALGNHDWGEPDTNADGVAAYTNYFDLPGNERYYDFAAGPVHFFALDSDRNEPDGVSPDSVQAHWLQSALAAATEPWKIVYFHHPPYSSGFFHGSDMYMRWPFKGWGASAVLAGHDHDYERLNVGGLPYFINGLGGGLRSPFAAPPSPFTEARYDGGYGAMNVRATDDSLHFEFIDTNGQLIDAYGIGRPAPVEAPPAAPSALSARGASDARVDLSWADNSDNETGFDVERSVDGGWRFDHLTTVDAGVTQYSDRFVSADTSYSYRIRAVNPEGASDFTQPAQARTGGIVPIFPAGSVWKYRADGADPGAAWRAPAFDDSGWPSGPAELGYGDGDEATAVPFGPSLDNRFVTTYFRRSFAAPAGMPAPLELRLNLHVDDGAVVYLNGQEVHRFNMPDASVNYLTRASQDIRLENEVEWRATDLPGTLLRPGTNVLAVEVHQYSTDFYPFDLGDMSFDLGLTASVDVAAPVASLAPPPPVDAGSPAFTFSVIYSDDVSLGAAPAGPSDILVTGPGGFSERAVLLRSVASPDGRTLDATYSVAAPGGAWDAEDAGAYTVSAIGDASTPGVRDSSGNPPRPGELGTFAWGVSPATLSGRLVVDVNLDARPGPGEPPLAGWPVYLDGNANGAFDPGERTAATGADGVYVFPGLAPGRYLPRPIPRPDWAVTSGPAAGAAPVQLAPGQTSAINDFTAAQNGSISGYAFVDVNGNGYFDANDVIGASRRVYLDLNDNGQPDAGEPASQTQASGFFSFAGLDPGTYLVRQVLPPGWRQGIPMESALVLKLGPGDVSTSNLLGATPAVADPGGPYAVDEGASVALSADASMAPGMMIRWYEWDFDYDGVAFTPDTARSDSPSAVFPAAGLDGGAAAGSTRAVAVRVYDDMGNTAVGATTVRVDNVAPSVDAGPDTRVLAGGMAHLVGSFADPGPDGWVATVDWGDGDGPRPLTLDADHRFAPEHVYGQPGTYHVTVTVTDDDGGAGSDTAAVNVFATGVAGRYVYYRGSVFDRRRVGETDSGAADDRSIAPDKRPLLPGQRATAANVTSYVRGINGLMIDLGRPFGSAPLTASDFVFETGSGEDPQSWRPAPAPLAVATRSGAGVNGADRVTVVWADRAVRNGWVKVTVLPGDHTGLADDDVFYFGNLAGKVANLPTDVPDASALAVTVLDLAAVRRRLFTKAFINSPFDLNRDGRVNSLDLIACFSNLRHTLELLTAPPATAPAAPR